MNRANDPNGWRKTYVAESARRPAPRSSGLTVVRFCIGFFPMLLLCLALMKLAIKISTAFATMADKIAGL